jgi:hypothetical protein
MGRIDIASWHQLTTSGQFSATPNSERVKPCPGRPARRKPPKARPKAVLKSSRHSYVVIWTSWVDYSPVDFTQRTTQ